MGADQYRPLHELLARHVPDGAGVLDWGAGLGHLSYVLAQSGYRAVGFALEECSFASWMDWNRYRFVRGGPSDPVRLPFASSSFDAVASVGVLEHVREIGGDESASLSEIHRVLRPGGAFVCVHFPNRWSWIELAARAFGRSGHAHRYTERDIAQLVRQADMTLIERFRYGFLPRNSWARFPEWARASRRLADAWNRADVGASALFNGLCQNYAFVARKPGRL